MQAALRVVILILSIITIGWPASANAVTNTTADAGDPAAHEASLVVFKRPVMVFRTDFLGASPAVRAKRARSVIEDALRQNDQLTVTIKANPEGQLVVLDDRLAFIIAPGDADPLAQETPEAVARQVKVRLEQIIAETRESRNVEALLKALGRCAIATAVFALTLWVLRRFRVWVSSLLLRKA